MDRCIAGIILFSFVSCYAQFSVNIDWDNVTAFSKTTTTLQVVVNPLLRRESPVHDEIFDNLAALNTDFIRYVPWLPYPRLAVAELEPPSGEFLCARLEGESGNNQTVSLTCKYGVIEQIVYASFGTPTGFCGSFVTGSCNAANSTSVVSHLCVGMQSCMIPVNTDMFGDPCVGTIKQFVVQATCSEPYNYTYWDFSVIDPMTLDFLKATEGVGNTNIINFSTIPQWMYQTPARVPYPDDPNEETWNYEQGTVLVDPTGKQVGEYYGRLVSWYTQGGLWDEYGNWLESGHYFTFKNWEVLNEVDYEHSNTPQSYTALYDAIVSGIQAVDPSVTFVGMALAGHYEFDWYEYFLNSSNHQPNIPLDFISYHFYASCNSRTDVTQYATFFPQVDTFAAEVAQIEVIRKQLSPDTRTTIDEIGVILPDDNDEGAAQFPLIYWNAAAAMFAYVFGNLVQQGIDVLGQSQLVGYPQLGDLAPQYPSVAELNWTTGDGTARYWALQLLCDSFEMGDEIVSTTVIQTNAPTQNPFCGSVINLTPLTLTCSNPNAVINKILFASYGTPTGSCGNWQVGSCNAANSTQIVTAACLGQNTCTINADTPTFGDPCYGTVKYLDVQAQCSSGGGYAGSSPVFAQGFVDTSRRQKVLLINKDYNAHQVVVGGVSSATFNYVDESTGFGPYASVASNGTVTLNPFAVAVLIVDN